MPNKGIIGGMVGFKIDERGFTEALDKRLGDLIREVGKAFVVKAVEIIPVWSGASRATLRKLGDKVGYNVSVFPVTRIDGRGRTRTAPNRIAEGEQHSEGEVVTQFPFYFYQYKSDLKWLVDNEQADMSAFIPLIQPGPYDFVKKAEEAAQQTLKRLLAGFKTSISRHIKPFAVRF